MRVRNFKQVNRLIKFLNLYNITIIAIKKENQWYKLYYVKRSIFDINYN